ncbi:hypothetical protein E3U55_03775 [Filobacillus milosensis]|uniref:Helicase Helix-turn-helix domain-containing protein n=1 Tax=Filobacillus milosensis TaxID=94137 RepID=A0A4Y8ISN2_9BACI|nr:helix-turn-helix domain-containing protein [Filobacillus milosensis]TFB23943.1 hypothetical protein E3U55_03775 [Filobacillus milosensis]
MIYFYHILLNMLTRLAKQRTISSAYHILRGKKSSQTLQDIHLFQLQPLYGIYPDLKKSTYDNWIDQLISQQFLLNTDDTFSLDLEKVGEIRDISKSFNGLIYNNFDKEFLKALKLLAQTLSNISYGQFRFIPLIDDMNIQWKVKKIIRENESKQDWLINQFYQELFKCLDEVDEIQAEIFVMQLSGVNRIGYSRKQLAELYQVNKEDIQLTTMNITHSLITMINNNPNQFPLLHSLIPAHKFHSITVSAAKTLELIQQGYSLEKIEQVRQLKLSTIQDHVVEIANQVIEFDIQQFVSESIEKEIKECLARTSTRRLKQIKDELHPSISYFQIRLVLAKLNQNEASEIINEPY